MFDTEAPRRRWVGFATAVMAVLVVAVALPFGGLARPADAAPFDCPPPGFDGFSPTDLVQRYGIADLIESGATGAGLTVVVLELEQTFSMEAVETFLECNGLPTPSIHTTLVGGGPAPAVGTEAQADVELIAALLPEAEIHVLVSTGDEFFDVMVDAALDPANTGGRPVDVISSSFLLCEGEIPQPYIDSSNAAFERMAEQGVWFLNAAGDEGSSQCEPKGACPPVTGATATVGYPASNPHVTSVGGTQIDAGGVDGPPEVWNDDDTEGVCGGGGGGVSSLFLRPAFQQRVGPAGETMRMVPDVSGLSGFPGYQFLTPQGEWTLLGGTSLATPTYAAGMLYVRSALQLHGLTPPRDLNTALYRAAADPVWYPLIFDDVTVGDNDVLGVGCCSATVGYDVASGLGELNFFALAQWMVANDPTPPPPPPPPPVPVVPSDGSGGLPVAAAVAARPAFAG